MHKSEIEFRKKDLLISPTIFFVLVIPFLVRMIELKYPVYRTLWSNNQPVNINIFTALKGYGVILIFILSLIVLILNKKDIKYTLYNKYDKLLTVSVIFIIISTLLSEYKYIALWGYKGRIEGLFVLISYLFLAYYTSKFYIDKKHFGFFNLTIYFLGLGLGIFGLLQAFGHDPFQMTWIQNLILKSGYTSESLNFKMPDGRVYMTLFNPNYVGSFVTLISGFTLNNIIRNEKIIKKIFWSILFTILLICLIKSGSEAGLVGLIFIILSTIVINYKYIYNRKKSIAIILIVFVIAISSLFQNKDFNKYIKSFKNSFKELTTQRNQNLQLLETEKNYLKIKYNNEKLLLIVNKESENGFVLIDDKTNEKKLKYNNKSKFYYPISDKLKGIRVYPREFNNLQGYIVKFENRNFKFVFTKDKIWYLNSYNRGVNLKEVEYIEMFKGYEHIGSGRFYIWSRTIPLLRKTWLVGYGPDNFVYNFPQMDYVGKNRSNLYMVNTIVDKPHNMYLQYAVNIGVIPLLILLAFWFMLLYELFKIVKAEELDDIYLTVAAASFSAIIGFMAVGMFNDSTVNVSTIFWGIVGLGLAVVNYNRYDHYKFKSDN